MKFFTYTDYTYKYVRREVTIYVIPSRSFTTIYNDFKSLWRMLEISFRSVRYVYLFPMKQRQQVSRSLNLCHYTSFKSPTKELSCLYIYEFILYVTHR